MPAQRHDIENSVPSRDAVRIFFRRLNGILFCASCAWIVWRTVWLTHPVSYEQGGAYNVIKFLMLACGPLVAAYLSLSALMERSFQGYWTKFSVGFLVTICFIGVWIASVEDGMDTAQSIIPLLLALILLATRLVVGLISLIVPDTAFCWERERKLHSLIVVSVAGPLLGLVVWSTLNMPIVGWRASAIAGSEPYCLQVPASKLDDAPVTRWGQLAGLRMQTPWEMSGGATAEEWQFSFHSVLVVSRGKKNEFYNWSYRSQNFVPITERTVSAAHVRADCEPKPAFLYTLDIF